MTAASVTDPNGEYPIRAGAFVGFDYSTTALRGGVMLVASPNGKDKLPKLGPDGQFIFNIADSNNMWVLIKDKIQAALASAEGLANTANANAIKAQSTADNAITGLAGKLDKADLTWANLAGKPSIPNADATTTVSSGDLNDYATTGKYYMPNSLSNYTNHPTTGTDMGDWFIMKVDVYKPAPMIVQTIYQVNSGDVWVRTKFGSNAWKSWRQVIFWPNGG